MSFKGKRVLVTGAGGFIGSHLVEELVHAGADVRALVHYNARGDIGNLAYVEPEVRDAVEVFFGDVRDPFLVNKALQSRQIVFHLAALIGIPYSYHAPQSYVETNIGGTLSVLQAARTLGLERVVQTSTSEVYGTARYTPIDEQHPLQPQSPYSASKIGADAMALSHHLSFELPVTLVRPFNTFGPRQSARAIIPTILSQLATRSPTLRLGSLTPVRDFNYVKDTARGFLAAAAEAATIGEVVNLGSGRCVTMAELVETSCKIADHYPTIETDPTRIRPERSEVMHLQCDNAKVTQLTQWRPEHSLEDGLRATLRFVEAHPELFAPQGYAI